MRSAGHVLARLGGLTTSAAACTAAAAASLARAPETPSFSARLYGAPFAVVGIVPNPIVTACYKATPDYTYLYVPAGVAGAAPAVRIHNYGADTRYLLSPSSAFNSGASPYRWKGSPLYRHEIGPNSDLALAPRPEGRRTRDRPAVVRGPGQKIDSALAPDLERGRLARPPAGLGDLRLGDAFRPTPWGAARAPDPPAAADPGECP